jgi:dTDP-D-glucose 4,6-dehydratase
LLRYSLHSGSRCTELDLQYGGWNEKANIDIVQTLCGLLDELAPAAGHQVISQKTG